MRLSIAVIITLCVLSFSTVNAAPEGAIEGTLVPPDATAKISALQQDTVIAAMDAGGKGGAFRLPLAAGTYTIVVTAPISSFPIRLENIVVQAGATTTLTPLMIMSGSGKAVLEGRVIPPGPESRITLLYEGKERAEAHADREGRYEFRGLPAGEYEVRATAPGHADDIAPVAIPENQRVQQTSVLLPVVATDGVDWNAGKIRATGVGYPPRDGANAAQVRAMTQRAAVADGQRNLLRIVEQIKIDGGRTVGMMMQSRNGYERIQGFLRGFTIVSERELGDGRIEVILELPLTGPTGLSRYLAE